jgi:mannose-1-phosphate guanylyltransferase
MLVLTSDHVIGPLEAFRADAEKAAALAMGTSPGAVPSLVVFGIAPSRPETGYGYIEAADGDSPAGGCFRALSFREKPDRETAERFLAAGNFYWNSGMFAFNSDFMLEQFRKNEPELLAPFEGLSVSGESAYTVHRGIRVLENWSGLEERPMRRPKLSIVTASVSNRLRVLRNIKHKPRLTRKKGTP